MNLQETRRDKSAIQRPLLLDKLPPHSIEAEQATLGCCLLDNFCWHEVQTVVGDKKEMFFDLRHQVIWESMQGKNDDLITVQQRIKDKGMLEQVGGLPYLSSLQDCVPSAANVSTYLGIIREKYLLRSMLKVCTDSVGKIWEHDGEVEALLDQVETDILAINNIRKTQEASPIGDSVSGVLEKIESYQANKGKVIGIPSGFAKLDFLLAGLHPSEVVIIAARPSEGKTALAMNIAESASMASNVPVGVFSMEMDKDAITFRAVCSRSEVDSMKAKHGDLDAEEIKRISKAAIEFRKAKLFIDDTPALTVNQVRARARRMVAKHGVKLLVIDYLQLMTSPKRKGEYNRQQEVSEISAGVKNLAKELKIPILLLSQLNRVIEKEKGRKPRLSDLRESGSIEQDADVVLMPYNPFPVEDDQEEPDEVDMNLLIAKNRNGVRNRSVNMVFRKKFTKFEEKRPKMPIIKQRPCKPAAGTEQGVQPWYNNELE